MKRLFTIVAAVLLTAAGWAQSPEKMNYQAVIRNSSDALVTDTSIGIQISILQGSATGSPVYIETQTPVTNANGMVSIIIGDGTTSDNFADIDWLDGPYFIKTETDPTGGTNFTITGTSQLMSVPYALHAKTADSIVNGVTLTEVDGSITNEIQDIQNVLAEGNDGGSNSLVNVSQITIGSSTPTPGTALEINSTNGALLLPRMSTTERDALTALEGMMIYNSEEKKFQGYSYSEGTSLIDQQNLAINNGGGEDRAQSFTAGMSGNLTAIELPFSTMEGTTDVNIAIRDGDGTNGAILHTQTFTIPGGGMTWYSFDISGVSIVAGNSYTIHVTEVSPGSCFDLCYEWGMDTSGNNYSGGLFYYNGTPYSGGIYDCAFKTYVGTPATSWVNLH